MEDVKMGKMARRSGPDQHNAMNVAAVRMMIRNFCSQNGCVRMACIGNTVESNDVNARATPRAMPTP